MFGALVVFGAVSVFSTAGGAVCAAMKAVHGYVFSYYYELGTNNITSCFFRFPLLQLPGV